MNSINLDGTWATIKTVLETMGFTVTEVTEGSVYKCYYTKDRNQKLYMKITNGSPNCTAQIFKSNDQSATNALSFTNSSSIRCTYDFVGDSLIFGFIGSNLLPSIKWIIVAPVSANDDWEYYQYDNNSWNIINGRTELPFSTSVAKLKTVAQVVQIVKVYDGARFLDNLYQTTISPDLPIANNGGNYAYFEIGQDKYIGINIFDSYTTRSWLCLKMAE